MRSKSVIFFTQVYFLDAALEHIRSSSNLCKMHVLIELTPELLNTNVLNISADLNKYPPLISFESVKDDWGLLAFGKYFEACESIHFVNHRKNNLFVSLSVTIKLLRLFRRVGFDLIHMDYFSLRQFFLVPFLAVYSNKVILNVHDPRMHLGEKYFSLALLRKIFFRFTGTFVVFSQFSKRQLEEVLGQDRRILVQKLLRYSIYREYSEQKVVEPVNITFVGRISPYKGIEAFISAIRIIKKQIPAARFFIAGKPIKDYNVRLDRDLEEFVKLKQSHLTICELVKVIEQSKLIVCPYKEATQSGVIMTAHSLGCPVLVSNVGGLAEYIEKNITGLVVDDLTPDSLAEEVINYYNQDLYGSMRKNIMTDSTSVYFRDLTSNLGVITALYS